MESPLPADDERGRLESLYSLDILDSPAEERFDRITRLAKALFDVPIALVSLVDDRRQWFKSRQGLTACETSREVSFCGHAILEETVLWIEDSLEDERFRDNPLVTGDPRVRFYAGYPLQDRHGHRLGTLCIIDHSPRSRTEVELELLADLGRIAEGELEALNLGAARLDIRERDPAQRRKKIDGVTGMWNRAGIEEIVELGLESCAEKSLPVTILVSELDEVASLRKTWTDEGMDVILAEAAQVLRSSVRTYDSIGRTGDGSFLAILSGLTPDDAQERVQHFQSEVDSSAALRSIRAHMHLGFASASTVDGPGDADALFAAAAASLELARRRRSVKSAA